MSLNIYYGENQTDIMTVLPDQKLVNLLDNYISSVPNIIYTKANLNGTDGEYKLIKANLDNSKVTDIKNYAKGIEGLKIGTENNNDSQSADTNWVANGNFLPLNVNYVDRSYSLGYSHQVSQNSTGIEGLLYYFENTTSAPICHTFGVINNNIYMKNNLTTPTKPAKTDYDLGTKNQIIMFDLCAGGGGGGGGCFWQVGKEVYLRSSGGGGGGGGAWCRFLIDFSKIETDGWFTIWVGNGGNGGKISSATGGDTGGTSYIDYWGDNRYYLLGGEGGKHAKSTADSSEGGKIKYNDIVGDDALNYFYYGAPSPREDKKHQWISHKDSLYFQQIFYGKGGGGGGNNAGPGTNFTASTDAIYQPIFDNNKYLVDRNIFNITYSSGDNRMARCGTNGAGGGGGGSSAIGIASNGTHSEEDKTKTPYGREACYGGGGGGGSGWGDGTSLSYTAAGRKGGNGVLIIHKPWVNQIPIPSTNQISCRCTDTYDGSYTINIYKIKDENATWNDIAATSSSWQNYLELLSTYTSGTRQSIEFHRDDEGYLAGAAFWEDWEPWILVDGTSRARVPLTEKPIGGAAYTCTGNSGG